MTDNQTGSAFADGSGVQMPFGGLLDPTGFPASVDDSQANYHEITHVSAASDGDSDPSVWDPDALRGAPAFSDDNTWEIASDPKAAGMPSRVANPSGDPTNYFTLGTEWLTGKGPRVHNFGPNDPATLELMWHPHVQAVRDQLANLDLYPGKSDDVSYSLKGPQGVQDYLNNYSLEGGNLAATYLGSFGMHYNVLSVDKDGRATVQFNAHNDSTIESATHPPILGYLPVWHKYIGDPLNKQFQTGPMSKTAQNFTWTEVIPQRK